MSRREEAAAAAQTVAKSSAPRPPLYAVVRDPRQDGSEIHLVAVDVVKLHSFLSNDGGATIALATDATLRRDLFHYAAGLAQAHGVPVLDEAARSIDEVGATIIPLPLGIHSIKELSSSPGREFVAELAQRERTPLHRQTAGDWLWTFDNTRDINVICADVPHEIQPFWADLTYRDYIRLASFADADALLEIATYLKNLYGFNRVVERKVSEVGPQDIQENLVLVGGLSTLTRDMSEQVRLPLKQASNPAGVPDVFVDQVSNREYGPTLGPGSRYLEDVSLFARLPHPSTKDGVLAICNGVLTHGVRGAALAFTHPDCRDINSRWIEGIVPPEAPYFVVLFRAFVFLGRTTPPFLTAPGTVLTLDLYDPNTSRYTRVRI